MATKNKNHHLEQRSDNWYFIAMVKGNRLIKPLSTSLATARKIRDKYLNEIALFGEIQTNKQSAMQGDNGELLFGEVAQQWIKIWETKIKSSTLRDYRGALNHYILPRFGNIPISKIGYIDIESFRSKLRCGNKRKNNVLVPMRSIMRFALKGELIAKNPMTHVDNLTTEKPDINALSMEEVNQFLNSVEPYYRNFFIVAFFTGMRFGEMAALKWINVDFKAGAIHVKETRVRGIEGSPKTKGSARDIQMLPPVVEALKELRNEARFTSPYVFVNKHKNPLLPNSISFHIWKPALKKAGLKERSLYQTRHTFACLMLDSGELPGWVQKMMGHESLKMILEHYYRHIKNYLRDDGRSFMENVFRPMQPDQPIR